jgi:hypothetical protein
MSDELNRLAEDMKKANEHVHEVTPDLLMFFGRMEAKLDASLLWMKRHEVEADRLTERVKRLEDAHARNMGVVAVVTFVATSIAGILSFTLLGGGQ